LVEKFFATVGTDKVFYIFHFVYLTFCVYYNTLKGICQLLFILRQHPKWRLC
jgi:hypothetical protein